jgi:Ca-activated chloride channel family protein
MDHDVLKTQLSQVESGLLVDGTAIGDGLGTAVGGLRQSGGKSRVVILLTDGVNNQGNLSPEDALRAAKAYGVKVYTIGIGSEGQAMAPANTPYGAQRQMQPVQIDEQLLQRIASGTGGRYYRATDNKSLQAIYAEIDQLEKSTVEISSFRQVSELFFPLALAAGICLLLELLLRATVFRSITG